MEFTNNLYASNPPPIKKLHSFLLSELGTQSRKVKYWGLTKEEAYSKAKNHTQKKTFFGLKSLYDSNQSTSTFERPRRTF